MKYKVREIALGSWNEFRDLVESEKYNSWAFRGQREASWSLDSALARYFKDFKIHPDVWKTQEERILRIFRRKAYKFMPSIPEEDNYFEWLALMQHHGAPTRLLDFTWSPYVAAFFALERATNHAAVWAICPPTISNGEARILRSGVKMEAGEIDPWINENYEDFFLKNREEVVLVGEPYRMNQRLIAQSGTFIIPGVLNKPVEEILVSQRFSKDAVVKFTLDAPAMRKQAMESLYRMNITNATLFPDLDGLARSLSFELEYHWAFDPITNKEKKFND
ncbi:MAG: FRG domain-containing protein [Cytophagales bacterium]|nr:FRG domain-containing protein [Cytophagales bacterium]